MMLQAENFATRFSEALAEWDQPLAESLLELAKKEVPKSFFGMLPGYREGFGEEPLHQFLFSDGSFLRVHVEKVRAETGGPEWPQYTICWGVLIRNATPVLGESVFCAPQYTKRLQEIAQRVEIDRKEFERIAQEETAYSQPFGINIPAELRGAQDSQAEGLVLAVAEALHTRNPEQLETVLAKTESGVLKCNRTTTFDDKIFLHLPYEERHWNHDTPAPIYRMGKLWRFQDGSEAFLQTTSLSFTISSKEERLSTPMVLEAIALRDSVPLSMARALADAVPSDEPATLFLEQRPAKLAAPEYQRGPWGWLTRFPELKKGEVRSYAYAAWVREAQENGSASMLEKALSCAFKECVWSSRTKKPAENKPEFYMYSDPAAEWWETLKFRFRDRSVLNVTLHGHHLTRHHLHVTEMPEKIGVTSVWF